MQRLEGLRSYGLRGMLGLRSAPTDVELVNKLMDMGDPSTYTEAEQVPTSPLPTKPGRRRARLAATVLAASTVVLSVGETQIQSGVNTLKTAGSEAAEGMTDVISFIADEIKHPGNRQKDVYKPVPVPKFGQEQ